MFNASQRISELERNVEELKRKAAQNSGEAEYIEKVVYTVKQSADDVKKVSKSLNVTAVLVKGPPLESPRDADLLWSVSETSQMTVCLLADFGQRWKKTGGDMQVPNEQS